MTIIYLLVILCVLRTSIGVGVQSESNSVDPTNDFENSEYEEA